jgi:hypothetical protein
MDNSRRGTARQTLQRGRDYDDTLPHLISDRIGPMSTEREISRIQVLTGIGGDIITRQSPTETKISNPNDNRVIIVGG